MDDRVLLWCTWLVVRVILLRRPIPTMTGLYLVACQSAETSHEPFSIRQSAAIWIDIWCWSRSHYVISIPLRFIISSWYKSIMFNDQFRSTINSAYGKMVWTGFCGRFRDWAARLKASLYPIESVIDTVLHRCCFRLTPQWFGIQNGWWLIWTEVITAYRLDWITRNK